MIRMGMYAAAPRWLSRGSAALLPRPCRPLPKRSRTRRITSDCAPPLRLARSVPLPPRPCRPSSKRSGSRVPGWVKRNPWPAAGIALVVLSWLVTGLLFWLRPLALLRINDFLSTDNPAALLQLLDKIGGGLSVLLGFRWFRYHPRVL